MNYVIGNIEGRYNEFNALFKMSDFNPECDKLYILGDFVGNTFNCLQLIETIIQNTRSGTFLPILGDKEEMYLEALECKKIPIEEKLLSEKGLIYSYYDNIKLRRSHMKFFASLPKYIETDKFIFSHLGVKVKENETIASYVKDKPHIEKNEKKHFYSHYRVNDFDASQLVYVDKSTNSFLVNKDVNNISSGGLLLLNIDTQETFSVKGTVL